MVKVSLSKIDEVFASLKNMAKLYIPVDFEPGQAQYKEYQEGMKLSSCLNTVRSAKDFFFPQTENLMDFKVEGKKIEVIDNRKESEDFIIFGVRACDVRSFSILDKVYLVEPVDTYYKSRREHGIIIALACSHPEETCFCSNFGIDAVNPGGDVSCWMDEKSLFLSANNEKGEKILSGLSELTEETDDGDVENIKADAKKILAKLPIQNLPLKKISEQEMLDLFNSPAWETLSEACLGCGTCTFVCPTCQCYDIKDFDTGHGVCRFRCWDSCMYSEFTKCAAANPRTTQLQRFRQRFMHKLVYFPENNNGEYGCVGCGRCLQKCPISMNIVKVIKKLGGSN